MPSSHGPGTLLCPNCREAIPVSLPELVASGSLHCPACGLDLHLDRRRSAQSVQMLTELEHGQSKARAILSNNRGPRA